MKRKPFNPRDYYALSLAAALDRLAREAKIVDCCTDPRKRRFVPMPDEGWPWVFIDYRRFDPARRAARDGLDSPLGAFLRSKPVLDETDAVRQRENQAFIDARGKVMRAFEDAVCPLIEALRAGHVVARGFRKGRFATEDIDPARWSMGWIIRRKDDTAQVEFFTDATSEDAEVILNGLHLAAPDGAQTPSQGDARRAAGEVQGAIAPIASTKRRRGPSKDYEPFLAMMENMIRSGEAVGPWQAAKELVQVKCIVPGSTLDESKIKKLDLEYRRSGRPMTKGAAQTNAHVTQK